MFSFKDKTLTEINQKIFAQFKTMLYICKTKERSPN